MKMMNNITMRETAVNFNDVTINIAAPTIRSEEIMTEKEINILINKIKKVGVAIVDNELIVNAVFIEGLLEGLYAAINHNCWCYVCNVNRNGLYNYTDYRVMLHSKRLPRK